MTKASGATWAKTGKGKVAPSESVLRALDGPLFDFGGLIVDVKPDAAIEAGTGGGKRDGCAPAKRRRRPSLHDEAKPKDKAD